MNARQRSLLINLNRALIFALSLTGLLMDGFQRADLLCTVALIVWLWLPLCTRVEANLLRWAESKRDHLGLVKTCSCIAPMYKKSLSWLTSPSSRNRARS